MIVDWNPKDLPFEKIGTCKSDDHEGKRRGLKCRLTMRMANDEEAIGEIQMYKSGTESYYCNDCYEALL